jgi:tRNA(Ile)-lysidine synthase
MAERICWTPFEKQVYLKVKDKIASKRIFVACSGGMDSVALVQVLFRLRKVLKIEIEIAHFFHGSAGSATQTRFRKKAQALVENLSRDLGLKFHLGALENSKSLSEGSLREARFNFFKSLVPPAGLLALAHHEDDLLETRLIRLIRGIGPEGLESMTLLDENRLRPFLEFPRSEIEAYAAQMKLKWIEDPSNKSVKPLRNWIRWKWLPSLEAKRGGARHSLARSLKQLSETVRGSNSWVEEYIRSEGICRPRLLELNRMEQRQVLASYLRRLGIKAYSLSHIEEVLKRVDNPRKEQRFKVIGLQWKINAEYIGIDRENRSKN